jgi:mutator protein MutT
MPDIVNGILLRQGKVLLAKRSPMRRAYAGRWSFPRGHVEDGETFDQALRRELAEEVGIVPTDYHAVADIDDPTDGSVVYRLYAVRAWRGEPAIRDTEHTELKWVALSTAGSMDELALPAYRPLFAKLASTGR